MKKRYNNNIDNSFNRFLDLVFYFLIILLLVSMLSFVIEIKKIDSRKKSYSFYDWGNHTSEYYHNYDVIPDKTCQKNNVVECEKICKDIFYRMHSKDTIGSNDFFVRDCYKICDTEIIK